MNVSINFADKTDAKEVMTFLHSYWSEKHILSKSRVLLDWQHYDPRTERYNFVLGKDSNGEILGLLGFIPTYHFDPHLSESTFLWLALWKVRDEVAPRGLGLRLHQFLKSQIPSIGMGTLGINEKVGQIYDLMGYDVGRLPQYYLLNQEKKNFEMVKRPDLSPVVSPTVNKEKNIREITLQTMDQIRETFKHYSIQKDLCPPEKTFTFLENRFLRHPFYTYRLFSVEQNEEPQGVLVFRPAQGVGKTALRLVDVYGSSECLRESFDLLQDIMVRFDAEYIDLYTRGFPADTLRSSGFTELDPESELIIPNYFEPFEHRNVTINYAYKFFEPPNNYYIFKADADQDRPNVLPDEET